MIYGWIQLKTFETSFLKRTWREQSGSPSGQKLSYLHNIFFFLHLQFYFLLSLQALLLTRILSFEKTRMTLHQVLLILPDQGVFVPLHNLFDILCEHIYAYLH